MSWVYSPGPAGGCLPLDCSGGALSAPSRSTSTASASSLSASGTDTSNPSPSGMTSTPLMATSGVDVSTSSAAGSPVKTSLVPGNESVWKELVRVCGSKCSELLAKCNLRLSSRRTAPICELTDFAPCSKDLPSWGMMLAGVCLELGTSVRLIDETECGSLLPTPTGAGNEGSPSMQKWPAHRALASMMLPTPMATNYGSNQGGAAGRTGKIRHNLEKTALLAGLLPTPIASDRNGDRQRGAGSIARGGGPRLVTSMAPGGGYIALREWMMCMPIGWTALERLETPRFLEWLHSHGKR